MLEISVNQPSLIACTGLMWCATGLRFYYIGDTDPASKLAIGNGHLWSWDRFMAAHIWAINFAKKKQLFTVCQQGSIKSLKGDDRLSQWSQLCHMKVTWYQVRLYKLKGALWTAYGLIIIKRILVRMGQCHVSFIVKFEPSCTSHKPRASYHRWLVHRDLQHEICPNAVTQWNIDIKCSLQVDLFYIKK